MQDKVSHPTLLDDVLRKIEPALNEINAMSLPAAEKKLRVRRLLQARIAALTGPGDGNASDLAPKQS